MSADTQSNLHVDVDFAENFPRINRDVHPEDGRTVDLTCEGCEGWMTGMSFGEMMGEEFDEKLAEALLEELKPSPYFQDCTPDWRSLFVEVQSNVNGEMLFDWCLRVTLDV
jgi:hypothetical protein